MLDAAMRALVVKAVQLFAAQVRMEERQNVCDELLKILQESASDGETMNRLVDLIECLQKP